MTEFEKRLPMWNAPGIEPPLDKTDEGWKKSERPPAEYMNFLHNTTFEALKELQENAAHKNVINRIQTDATEAKKKADETSEQIGVLSDLGTAPRSLTKTISEKEVNVKDLGVKGDGTNESTLLLSAINYAADNHVTLFIPKNMTITVDVMTVTNKENFGIRCEGTIKRMDNSPTVGSLLKVDGCFNVTIPEINFDGNGLNNGCVENVAYTPNQEQKHCLSISNSSHVRIDDFYVLNPCGDGIYITNGCKDIKIKNVKGKADAQIGRNLVSLIHCEDINIDYIYSDNIGHFDMPGGFDIEPNHATEVVRNVFIGQVNITGGGTCPFAIQATNSATTENIFVNSVNLIRTNIIDPGKEINSVIVSGSNVHIDKISAINNTIYNPTFIVIENHGKTTKGIYIKSSYAENCYRGITFGYRAMVENIEIKAVIRNAKFDGVDFFNANNVKLEIDIDSVGVDRFMINKPTSGGVVENITISGDISKRGTGLMAIINGDVSGNMKNWLLKDLDFTGWKQGEKLYGNGMFGSVRKDNCPNLTYSNVVPNFDVYKQGDVVKNTNTAELGTVGSKYIVEKWIAVSDGQSSSIWRESRVLTGN